MNQGSKKKNEEYTHIKKSEKGIPIDIFIIFIVILY